MLVENEQDVEELEVEDPERVAYITQTTLAVDETSAILERLRERFPSIVGPRTDDICYATTNRQAAVKQMAASCDLMLVIGSRNSSNSVRLVEVARDCGTEAHLIDSAREFKEEWLEGRRVVGISSGASAPEELVTELVELFRRAAWRTSPSSTWSARTSASCCPSRSARPSRARRIQVAWPGPPDLRKQAGGAPWRERAGNRAPAVISHAHADPERLPSAMRTLIVSDLHLGSLSRSDLLRRPELRAPLLEAVADVDRVVLLGDVLELRHGPMREALAAARPFFEDLGRALGWAGARDRRRQPRPRARRTVARTSRRGAPARRRSATSSCSSPRRPPRRSERIAGWVAPARMRVAYPGLWVRPDVYATHGHYLDCHLTVPTLERLRVGAMSRLLGRPASAFRCVDDYEAVGAPMFAWRDTVARDARTGAALNGVATVVAWDALRSAGTPAAPRRGASRRAGCAAARSPPRFPLAVAALNRAGIGPLHADVSIGELRRAGLRAMGEVAARLDLGDAYVVFGHTHRPGPLAGTDRGVARACGGAGS